MAAAPYVEPDCKIEFQGRTFESGGAMIFPDAIVGYVGKPLDRAGRYELTTWHGEKIGTLQVTSTWRTPRSWVSSTMSQAVATVDGVRYTGRTAGEGMVFKGKRVKG